MSHPYPVCVRLRGTHAHARHRLNAGPKLVWPDNHCLGLPHFCGHNNDSHDVGVHVLQCSLPCRLHQCHAAKAPCLHAGSSFLWGCDPYNSSASRHQMLSALHVGAPIAKKPFAVHAQFHPIQCLVEQRLCSRQVVQVLCASALHRYGTVGSVNATCTAGAWATVGTCAGEFDYCKMVTHPVLVLRPPRGPLSMRAATS